MCVWYIYTHIHISFFRFTGIPASGNRDLSTRKSPALSLHLLHILCYFFQNSNWMYVRPSFSILHIPKHFLPMFHPCTCVSFWATSSNLPPDSLTYLTTCTYHPVTSSPWKLVPITVEFLYTGSMRFLSKAGKYLVYTDVVYPSTWFPHLFLCA